MTDVKRCGSALTACLAALGSSFSMPILAQVNTSALEEIVVTARRKEESLQTVPISITAMSGEYLRDNNIDKFEDIQYHAPGLKITTSGASDQEPVIALRGQRPSEAIISIEPAVHLYFNDVVISPSAGSNVSLYDLQNVQVLKGPQGTLFGRNSTGGAILFSPAKPGDELDGFLQLGAGNYNRFESEFGVNIPVSDDVKFRLAGKTVDRDGYVENLSPTGDSDIWDDKSRALRLSSVINFTDNLENYSVITWDELDAAGRKPRLAAVNPGNPLGGFIQFMIDSGVIADQPGLNDPSVVETDTKNHFDRVEAWFTSNTTTWSTDNLIVKNIFGYRNVENETTLDTDGTGLSLLGTPPGLPNVTDAESFSEEIQFQGKEFEDKLEWITGIYFYKMDGTRVQNSGSPVGLSINTGDVDNRSIAWFVQGSYDFGEKWSSTLGLRRSWDERNVAVGDTLNGICITEDDSGNFLPANNCQINNSEKWTANTWLVNLNYQLSETAMAYASFSTGYRAGGFNLRGKSPQELTPFDEENVTNYELGLKADWDLAGMQVRTNLAAYRQDYQDIQVTTAVPGASGNGNLISITSNAAEATIEGLDLELTLIPTDNLTFSVNYTYVDTEFDEYFDTTTTALNPPLPPLDLSGSQFKHIPKDQITATIRYMLPLDSALGDISLQANVYYQSDVILLYRSPIVDDAIEDLVRIQDAYGVQNYQIDWASLLGSPLDLSLYIKNASNEEYVVGGQPVLAQLGAALYNYGEPRTYGLAATYHF